MGCCGPASWWGTARKGLSNFLLQNATNILNKVLCWMRNVCPACSPYFNRSHQLWICTVTGTPFHCLLMMSDWWHWLHLPLRLQSPLTPPITLDSSTISNPIEAWRSIAKLTCRCYHQRKSHATKRTYQISMRGIYRCLYVVIADSVVLKVYSTGDVGWAADASYGASVQCHYCCTWPRWLCYHDGGDGQWHTSNHHNICWLCEYMNKFGEFKLFSYPCIWLSSSLFVILSFVVVLPAKKLLCFSLVVSSNQKTFQLQSAVSYLMILLWNDSMI
jgi:hypothetical protein